MTRQTGFECLLEDGNFIHTQSQCNQWPCHKRLMCSVDISSLHFECCSVRVWLKKGFNFTFTCPAVINVWAVLWVFLKLCDIASICISPFKIFPALFFRASLKHVNYDSHPTLKLYYFNIYIYIFAHACRLGFLSLLNLISVRVSNFRWDDPVHLWVERAPCWTSLYFLIACDVKGEESFFE